MSNEQTAIREKTRIEVNTPRRFMVIFINDDFTSMEFVVNVLVTVFHKPVHDAEQLMLKVHHEGQAVVGVYSFDVARTRTELTLQMARNEGFPLQVIYRPES